MEQELTIAAFAATAIFCDSSTKIKAKEEKPKKPTPKFKQPKINKYFKCKSDKIARLKTIYNKGRVLIDKSMSLEKVLLTLRKTKIRLMD